MKRVLSSATCGIALVALVGTTALAAAPAQRQGGQGRAQADQNTQGHTQFTDADRKVAQDWNSQHQKNPPAGLRPKDRLSADQESRLQPGRPLDPDLRKQEHPVPADLGRRLPPPPRNNKYVAIGGHVGLVDSATQVLRDVIHLH
jgi:Ni/Co efflux regulator RcnB